MTRPELVSFDDALVAMMGHANPVAQREQVATMQATGRVLADDLRAPMNVPAMDNTQMDGYAVRAAEVTPGRPLAVAQRIAAGQVPGPLAAGTVFGFGLALSTMIRPEVVLSFLQLRDLGLALVMGGGVAVTLLAYKLLPRLLKQPLLGGSFGVHPSAWNRDTLRGAALFGIGWGLTGVCPGPAIAGLGAGNFSLLWAVAGIALGALAQGWRADRQA